MLLTRAHAHRYGVLRGVVNAAIGIPPLLPLDAQLCTIRKECLSETMLLYNAHICRVLLVWSWLCQQEGSWKVPCFYYLNAEVRGPLRQHNKLASQQFSLLSLLLLVPLPTQHAYSHSLPLSALTHSRRSQNRRTRTAAHGSAKKLQSTFCTMVMQLFSCTERLH